jgi:hypothetical protein
MNRTANAALGFTVEIAPTISINASPQPDGCLVGKLLLPAPPPTVPMPPEAASGGTGQVNAPPPVETVSVVAKVTKLLINQDQFPRLEYPIRWKDGFLHQKVRTSLHANHQL